jgi:hypothetical protein
LTKLVLGKPLLSNLAIFRPAPPILSPDEETKLLRAGDYGELIERHLPFIRAECRKRWQQLKPWQRPERALIFDDFVAAAVERFLTAARNYLPGANNGLNAYARLWIAGAISDTATDYRNVLGFAGLEGDLQRIVRSRLFWDPEWIREKWPQYSAAQIEQAQKIELATIRAGKRGARPPEQFRDAQAAYRVGAVTSLLKLRPIVAGGRVDVRALWRLRGVHLWVGRVRIRGNKYCIRYSAGSLWNDFVWDRYELQQRALLQLMGRQGYADWLVERDHKRGTVVERWCLYPEETRTERHRKQRARIMARPHVLSLSYLDLGVKQPPESTEPEGWQVVVELERAERDARLRQQRLQQPAKHAEPKRKRKKKKPVAVKYTWRDLGNGVRVRIVPPAFNAADFVKATKEAEMSIIGTEKAAA